MNSHTLHRILPAALALPLALAVLGPVTGCRKAPVQIAPDVAASDEALFKLGEAAIKKDSEKGMLYLRQLIDSFPKSFYAQRAKLLIADTYFKKGDEGNMILAAAEYREFIKAYPYSPSAAYCQYQIAMSFYKKVEKTGRDQTKTTQALTEFRKVIADYPASDQAKDAQAKVKDCEERLASHAADIGVQYARMKAPRAAISRLTEVMTTYPDFSRMDLVYFYLGEAYIAARAPEKAVPYYTKLLSDYAKSPLVKKATARLKAIEEQKKAPAKPRAKAR
ncbi:MAG TPA: outer membrane protein assembly factor BamD [Terriglobales bacterium]|nr:outer membrane protein assembly factor BamD [Terriglobales bacterium]